MCGEYAKGLGRFASAGSGRDAGHRLLPFKRLGGRDADAPGRLPQLPGLHFPHRIYVEGRSERRCPAGGISRGAEEFGLSRLFSDDLRIPRSPANDLLGRFHFPVAQFRHSDAAGQRVECSQHPGLSGPPRRLHQIVDVGVGLCRPRRRLHHFPFRPGQLFHFGISKYFEPIRRKDSPQKRRRSGFSLFFFQILAPNL